MSAQLALQATWNEPVQAGQHFKNVLAPWCKSMWAAGHRLHVEVRLHEDAKTDRQRAYYHGVVLKTIAQQAMAGAKPFGGAVALSAVARFSIPASWSKKRRQAAMDGLEYVTKRPDLDNLLKAIKDGMNGIAWLDDSQVVSLVDCRKVYAEQPGVDVIVAGLEPAEVPE